MSPIATALYQDKLVLRSKSFVDRWFFTAVAGAMVVVAIAGFAPAIVNPVGRRGPVALLAAAHGIVFFVWLLLFLAQSLLIALHRVAWHRRLGIASAFVLPLMVALGYSTTVTMVRRGFDLSGDQFIESNPRAGYLDPFTGSVFNFTSLLIFAALVAAALYFRRRPAIHKRLMLFANIELTLASFTHFLGHFKMLTAATVLGSAGVFLSAVVVRDYLVDKRVHPLTAALVIGFFVSLPVRAILIGPSAAWHSLVSWLIQAKT